MMKKGQAAMEYLMTYGWAILVIVLVLAVLFYLGVFSPSVPAVCTAEAPFSCVDHNVAYNTSTVTIVLGTTSAANAPILATAIGNGVACTGVPHSFTAGTQETLTLTCPGINATGPYSGTLSFTYSGAGGLSHTASGSFSGTAS